MRECLTLRSELTEVARMKLWVEAVTAPLSPSSRTAHALQLCLEEAVTNVISHAFLPGERHDIRIVLWGDEDLLHVEITDSGPAFDPLSHRLPVAPKELALAPIGGLGIKLMRSLADGITYRRCGANNRLTLSFRT
jgi:anti-sigma regulatory factor (Ser/Thr protein kinase)